MQKERDVHDQSNMMDGTRILTAAGTTEENSVTWLAVGIVVFPKRNEVSNFDMRIEIERIHTYISALTPGHSTSCL